MSRPIPRFSDYCRHVVCTTLWHCDPLPPRKTSRGTGPTTCLVITSPRRESQYIGDGQWMPGTRRHGLSCTAQRIEDIWKLSSCYSITVPMQTHRTNDARRGYTLQHKADTRCADPHGRTDKGETPFQVASKGAEHKSSHCYWSAWASSRMEDVDVEMRD